MSCVLGLNGHMAAPQKLYPKFSPFINLDIGQDMCQVTNILKSFSSTEERLDEILKNE